ncbi:MAG TPA: cytochrome c maturation protein CcmE [Thermoanaerobaculia bacterium]|nr:cytochrome c maturation protein CcmE [Thermoanaerobaculia bacterium]
MSAPSMKGSARKRNRIFLVVAIAIALGAFLVITAGGIGKNLVYYWNPSELHAAGDKAYGATIRLGGLVREGSIVQGQGVSTLEFDVTDLTSHVHVKAGGVPPQMFREGIGVVIEGTMTRAGHFQGNKLMVSHDNEYRAPTQGEEIDSEALIKSTKGMAAEVTP